MIAKYKAVLLLYAVCATPAYAQKKFALVIGVAGYPGFPDGERLKYAGRDAVDFAAFIKSAQGGLFPSSNVHLLTNSDAKREPLYREFDWLYQNVGPNDVVYVFFAGHGVEYRNVLYFLPYDASKERPDALGIPMTEFFRKVTRDLSAKQVVVFVDACHAAGASEGARSPLSVDIQKQWESANEKEGQFSMALFSSLAYQKSWEDADLGGGHGLFTWYILEGLKGGAPRTSQGLITADSLWTYVKDKVEARSKARFPQLQTPYASAGFRTEFNLAFSESVSAPVSMKANSIDGLNYILIPSGSFEMGCFEDPRCGEHEKPVHSVTITHAFWLAQTPVTVAAWRRYRKSTGAAPLPTIDALGHNDLNEASHDETLPVVLVTWEEADRFCKWAGGRLPSEAEYEYAERAGARVQRYGDIEAISWYARNSGRSAIDADEIFRSEPDNYQKRLIDNQSGVKPVALKQHNNWNLYDMLGNVAQWTADWYDPEYFNHSPTNDPTGPKTSLGKGKSVRGASWYWISDWVRSANRGGYEGRLFDIGFRCALREEDSLDSQPSPNKAKDLKYFNKRVTLADLGPTVQQPLPSGLSEEQQIGLLKQRPSLLLDRSTLFIGEVGDNSDVIITVNTLTLVNGGKIVTNGNTLRLKAARIISNDGLITSFSPTELARPDAPIGTKGLPGSSGGKADLAALEGFDGVLPVRLPGQNGGRGGPGQQGAGGAPGARGADGVDHIFDCASGGGNGAVGGPGVQGSSGFPGGNAGNGGTLVLGGQLAFGSDHVLFAAPGGKGGRGGNGGLGGPGGPGGQGGSGSAHCNGGHPGTTGTPGPPGKEGPAGTDGISGKVYRGDQR